MSTAMFVVVEVGTGGYLLPAARVRELETFTGATQVPAAPEYVAGIVHVRGRVVPVIDLRQRFGLQPVERGLDCRVIVVESDGRAVGLVADRARELLRVPEESLKPPPRVVVDGAGGFVNGIVEVGQRIFMLLDVERIIGLKRPELPGNEEEEHGERGLPVGEQQRRRALAR